MTRWTKLAAIALVVTLCVTALGISTSTANAQTAAPTQPPTQNARPQILRTLATALLQATEKATDLSQADLIAELGTGKTLADVIKAHNADLTTIEADAKTTITTTIAQAVTNGKLTQAQADQLTKRIDPALDRLVNHAFPTKEDRRTRLLRAAALNILVKATADASKISQRDLLKEIRDGKTLSQIATEHSADPTQIVATAVTQATDRINKAVTAGKLKDDQAKTLIANLSPSLTTLMNTPNPLGKGGKVSKGQNGTGSSTTPPATDPVPEGTPSL